MNERTIISTGKDTEARTLLRREVVETPEYVEIIFHKRVNDSQAMNFANNNGERLTAKRWNDQYTPFINDVDTMGTNLVEEFANVGITLTKGDVEHTAQAIRIKLFK